MRISKKFTTVTPLSKAIALLMFIAFPIIGFYYGSYYQSAIDVSKQQDVIVEYKLITPTPTTTQNQNSQATLSCSTSRDCPPGYYCMRTGPIVEQTDNASALPGLTCHKIGVAVPQ